MTGLAMSTRARPDTTDEWETPPEVFGPLHEEFGFTLDVCASEANAKVPRYFSLADNGLWRAWAPAVCWMNPPYGTELGPWVRKAWSEVGAGATVVGLVPARTDTAWFHRYVLGKAELRFVEGRIRFLRPDKARDRAPFPSLVIVWRP